MTPVLLMELFFDSSDSSTSSSSSSSSDGFEEEITVAIVQCLSSVLTEKRRKIRGYIDNVVSKYTDEQFKRHFRLSRLSCAKVTEQFLCSEWCPKDVKTGGKKPIPKESYVLIFLWYAGNKSSLRQVANRFGVSESLVHRCTNVVMDFLVDLSQTVIRFPASSAEKKASADKFRQLSDFPDILGCIDDSIINIVTFAHKTRLSNTQRQDLSSISLQAVCDSDCRFLDVFTGTSCDISDSRIHNTSPVFDKLQSVCDDKFHILGNESHAIREWLLTPYRNHGECLTAAKQKFNDKFCASHVPVKNAFGILKKRFVQLERLDMRGVNRISKFIVACCVLHNICIDCNDTIEIEMVTQDAQNTRAPQLNSDPESQKLHHLGEIKRDVICNAL